LRLDLGEDEPRGSCISVVKGILGASLVWCSTALANMLYYVVGN